MLRLLGILAQNSDNYIYYLCGNRGATAGCHCWVPLLVPLALLVPLLVPLPIQVVPILRISRLL